ncbi:MAG TPA: RT0821/Lpp0805 family surface protein [Mariprofundaceae bacterium]|nr:RT0821/Lpp0805 family surface protein [Mariprofundaceae bacterium]
MKKVVIILLAAALSMPLAGCQTKQQTGAVMGGVLGGVLGSTMGRGSGRTAAIVAGTLLGAYVGSEMGRYMDESDARKAQAALEYNRDNQSSSWHNPNTGADFETTPTRTYRADNGQDCRDYETDIIVNGKHEKAHGTACRQPDGTWKTVD